MGEQTFRLTNIVRAEPDPSLLAVPSDFKIIDGGPKTIIYREKPIDSPHCLKSGGATTPPPHGSRCHHFLPMCTFVHPAAYSAMIGVLGCG